MELNRAMFARAGRSGYVLKPEILRRKGPEKDKDALVRIAHYILEIEVRSHAALFDIRWLLTDGIIDSGYFCSTAATESR